MNNGKYEYQKKLPKYGQVDIDKFIRYGGYYDVNNNWNSIVMVEGYPNMIFRGRVEVFLFKDNKVYIDIAPNRYRIPGGSFDINRSNYSQVYNELKEETKILSKNIFYTGISYVTLFDRMDSPSKRVMTWNGTYNEIYLAEYSKPYTGYVKSTLFDSNMHNNGDFHSLVDILPILKPEHLTALKKVNII